MKAGCAMQIATVYACVRLLAESVAGLPLHLYRFTDDAENGKEKAKDHPLYRLLLIVSVIDDWLDSSYSTVTLFARFLG